MAMRPRRKCSPELFGKSTDAGKAFRDADKVLWIDIL
jgi:hypothetical protein